MRLREKISTRLALWVMLLAMVGGAVWSCQSRLQAQGDVPGEPEQAADAPAEGELPKAKGKTLGEMLWNGGEPIGLAFYTVLGLFSIAAFTIGLERLVNLRRGLVAPPKFNKMLREMLLKQEGTSEGFRRLCETSDTPISRILRAAVLRAGRPLMEVEKAMEDAVARETAGLRARNRPLSVLGNVAPLVGLLGTVVGMIMSFSIASSRGLGQGEDLAMGISLALLTTASGLFIAIPSLLVLALLSARVERYMREIDECLMETMPSFGKMENQPAPVKAPDNGELVSSD